MIVDVHLIRVHVVGMEPGWVARVDEEWRHCGRGLIRRRWIQLRVAERRRRRRWWENKRRRNHRLLIQLVFGRRDCSLRLLAGRVRLHETILIVNAGARVVAELIWGGVGRRRWRVRVIRTGAVVVIACIDEFLKRAHQIRKIRWLGLSWARSWRVH